MTEIEKKALVFVNEVRTDRGWSPNLILSEHDCSRTEALCRAVEQYEAFKLEVSDAVEELAVCVYSDSSSIVRSYMGRFIIPKPDPLVEALGELADRNMEAEQAAATLRAALAARGLEVRKIGEGE